MHSWQYNRIVRKNNSCIRGDKSVHSWQLKTISMQLTKLNIKFEALNDSLLPGQLGSMLRGIFGEALMQYDEKLYNKFFHPEVSPDNPAYKYVSNSPPAPFIFFPLKKYDYIRRGQSIDIHLTLIGKYALFKQEVIEVIKLMTEQTWYHQKLQVKLLEIKPEKNGEKTEFDYNDFLQKIPQKDTYSLIFKSPLSIASSKKLIADFDFDRLMHNLYRRLYVLEYLYGNGNLPEQPAFEHTGIFPVSIQLKRQTVYRSPKRQEKYPMFGWKGSITYKGDFRPVYPLLQFGQHIHLGSYIAFGFGKYILK